MLVVGGPLLLVTAASAYVAVDSLVTLIVIRLLAGVGEGLVFVGGASVIADLAPAARRGEAMSYFTLASNGGLALGPLLGEFVLSGDRYDAVWLTAAAIAGSAAVLALAVPETQPEQQEVPAERLIHRTALGPGLVLLCALIGVGGFNAFIALYAIELGLGGGGIVFLEFGVIVVAVRLFGARIPDLLGPAKCGRVALLLSRSDLHLWVSGKSRPDCSRQRPLWHSVSHWSIRRLSPTS